MELKFKSVVVKFTQKKGKRTFIYWDVLFNMDAQGHLYADIYNNGKHESCQTGLNILTTDFVAEAKRLIELPF